MLVLSRDDSVIGIGWPITFRSADSVISKAQPSSALAVARTGSTMKCEAASTPS